MAKRAGILSRADCDNFGALLERLHKAGVPIASVSLDCEKGLTALTGQPLEELSELEKWQAENGQS